MDPRKTPNRPDEKLPDDAPALPDLPTLEEQDWEAIESGVIRPGPTPENGDLRYEHAGESLEEEDDNPHQHSDEALPDDEKEEALARNPGKEGSRFDEV